MPNWCENTLTIEGPRTLLALFAAKAKVGEKVLSEEPFIPYPAKFAKMDLARKKWEDSHPGKSYPKKDGFNSGGYEWCSKTWGSKWGFCSAALIEFSENTLVYQFNSAWNPPTPLIAKMAEMFPVLTFELDYTFEEAPGESFSKTWHGKVSEPAVAK